MNNTKLKNINRLINKINLEEAIESLNEDYEYNWNLCEKYQKADKEKEWKVYINELKKLNSIRNYINSENNNKYDKKEFYYYWYYITRNLKGTLKNIERRRIISLIKGS